MRLWFLFPLLVLTSCSLQATLTLGPQAGGDMVVAFQVSPQALSAWSNLRDLDPSLPTDPLSPSVLQANLGPQGKVVVQGGETRVSLTVADLQKFLPLKKDDTLWEGTIDRAAVRRWLNLTNWAGSPAVDALIPGPGTVVTEAEYRDLLVYLLGPGTPEGAARTLVDASSLQLTIVAPRPIKAAPGSVSVSGKSALYRWPLVRILALEKPLPLRLIF